MKRYTPKPWIVRIYANEPEDIERMKKLGMQPVRMLTNEGQVPILAGNADGEPRTRICVVDCQANFKRGQGHKTECEERDANARLIGSAPDLDDLARDIAEFFKCTDSPLGARARELVAIVDGEKEAASA